MSNVSSSNGLEKRPKLRFPGFDEPWNETAFEDLGNFYNGISGKDKNDFGKGDDRYITYMNVYKNVIADIHGCDVVRIKEGEHQNRVNFGDLLFTQSSETLDEVGLTSVWLHDYTPLLNSFCFGFHFDTPSLINPRFAAYSMRTPYARKRIAREGQGATRYNLSSNRLKKVKILYPSHSEQDIIAGLLSLLETRIERQCEIIDQLKKYKRGLLQYAFPQKGEVVPQLRFAGFSGDWERRKISDMFKVTRGYVLAATLTEENQTDEMPYPVYSSQTKDDGLMGYYKDFLYENAITWTTDGANAGTVNYRAGKFYCTNVCGVLISNEVKTSKMIAEALNNVAKNYVSYVGNPKLMNNVMADIEIMIPVSSLEQEKVSNLFAVLDNLITLHQRRLDNLTKYKKGLLQQLFI